ncbi:transcriptional repressor NF-X1-like [Acanthaster planci]|uniref:Transcriptional repressor NF-X1-like n=1 Tax=Acanthaster planci TaxID=133434 RepID=A0A8B7YE28_ACAPL|nr:transcriptional repressor NF-X1-like [Acanthaster planci]
MAESKLRETAPEFHPVQSQSYTPQYHYSEQQNFQPYQQYLYTQNYGPTDPTYTGHGARGRPFSRRERGRYRQNFSQAFEASTGSYQPAYGGEFYLPAAIPGNFNQEEFFGLHSQRGVAGVRGRGMRSPRGLFRGQNHPKPQLYFHGQAPAVNSDLQQPVGSSLESGRGDRRPELGRGRGKTNAAKQQNRNEFGKARNRPKYRGSTETQTGSMIEQLTEGSYECTVCCETVRCDSPIWSCQECYTVFHLRCIKKWAKSPAAATEDSDGWQCPMCRNITLPIPYAYKCFCSKMRDPPFHPGEMPHSCGEVCRRKRAKTNCVHPCSILCHPGPCPPCPANIKQSCLCKRTSQTVRCGTAQVIRCQSECGRKLNCGTHTCEVVCHEGSCEPCQVELKQECYCGKDSRVVLCSLDDDGNLLKEGRARYPCKAICDRMLPCGNHTCKRLCHPAPCDPCPLTPDLVTHCPCGQTKLMELAPDGGARKTCLDPVPTCKNTCGKPLKCGGDNVHTCKETCHEGDCPACPLTSTVRCRCGHRMIDVLCRDLVQSYDASTGLVSMLCDRKCPKKKDCGKHKCNTKCCVAKEHHCNLICGRMLNCGLHRCEEMCHPGNCVRCLNASFEEYTCHCGATVMMPPIRCGTKPPECDQLCARQHDCDHPVRHTCHNEDVCPPCAELTSKMCMGNHEMRYNIPCHIKDISCGHPCGKKLPCRMHTCKMICHKVICEDCKQPCLVPRPECGHPCSAPCHMGTPCPPSQCKTRFVIRCACGNRSETVQCLQGGDDARLTEAFQRLATSTLAGQGSQSGQDVDISQLMALRNSKTQRQLECNQKCAILSRNKRLADALQIKDPDTSKIPTVYSAFLKEQARKNPQLIANIIKELSALVTSAQSSKQPSRSHAFPVMNQNQRRVVHELSEMYRCESQSYDQEPKRNVVTTARKGMCFIPTVSLSVVIERETHPKAPPPIMHTKHEAPRRLTSLSKMPRPESPTSPPPPQKEPEVDNTEVPDSWEVR